MAGRNPFRSGRAPYKRRLREIIALVSSNERDSGMTENKEQKVWIGLCAPSDKHDLGIFMMLQLLRNRGWKAYFLGPDVPVNDLVSLAKKYKPDLINISIISDQFQNGLEAYLESLDGNKNIDCPLVISGNGFSRESTENYRKVRYFNSLLDKGYDFALEFEKDG